MTAQRKDDHVQHAVDQQRRIGGDSEFDDVRFVHHALAGINQPDVCLATTFAGISLPTPLYINAMTGGSRNTQRINAGLAIAARETGVAIASGSVSAYFKDPSCAETYRVIRAENPNGFVLANVNATTSVEDALRAVSLLDANALQIHLNIAQETVMPEGDRSFGGWAAQIERIVSAVDVPVIVKEVGFGLSRETLIVLKELGVEIADVGGRGGTNFIRIEDQRRETRAFDYLTHWGQSTPACLLEAQGTGITVLASGGIRHPLDVARSLALGASAVGISGAFLKTLVDDGVPALIAQISTWLEQLTALQTMLGARLPRDLAQCDLTITGSLRSYCIDRGIDLSSLAHRSSRTGVRRES
ncbi:MAG TPA: type 2 isopentenyl-diphosphate Delta-isomerase [Marmoricola sp.]|nr:type 2 isopentenyl-diphosphate Delta-isomerase [Marmoricola sp.]